MKQQAKLAKRANRPDEPRCELRRRNGAAVTHAAAPVPSAAAAGTVAVYGAAHGSAFGAGYGGGLGAAYGPGLGAQAPEHGDGHGRAACNVRVNRLHACAGEALETDV